MTLTNRKIEWIIGQKTAGKLSTNDIALLQNVHPSRVRQLWAEYIKTGEVPQLKKAGRPKRIISEWEEGKVVETFASRPSNAVALEKLLKQQGINISHHLIHYILKKHGLSASELNKSKRRKWVKYERRHSNSLWHTDYYMVEDPRWRGKWFIAYIDDASRMVTGWGLFNEATTENALLVLDEAIAKWGRPSAIMTDHGSQFFSNYGDVKSPGITSFQEHLVKLGIRHILERVGHPQSNGKIERFFGSLQLRVKHFNSVDEYVTYYNERRPHMSLDFDKLETPMQAFCRKWDNRRKPTRHVQQLMVGGRQILT